MFNSPPAGDAGSTPGASASGTSSGPSGTPGREDRALVLVDVENLVGGSDRCTPDAVRELREQLFRLAGVQERDQVIAAFGQTAAKMGALYAWEGGLRKVRHGIDGADTVLISLADSMMGNDGIGKLVVCSGDGGFTGTCEKAKSKGIFTTVVASDPFALSGRMQKVADEVRLLSVAPRGGDC